MKLVGIMPVRNEDWVLGFSARAALMWCDELIVLLHNSTDRSADILIELGEPERVHIFRDISPEWTEMSHRQMLLNAARTHGATHIVTIDADEVLTGNLLPSIRGMIENLSPGQVLNLPWLATPGRIDRFLMQGPWADPFVSVAWMDDPRFHWSSAARHGYDFHQRHPLCRAGKRYQTFEAPVKSHREGGILHLQFLSRRRLKAKQALYKMQEVIRWPDLPSPEGMTRLEWINQQYDRAVYGSDPRVYGCLDCPDDWLKPYSLLYAQQVSSLALPWQEAECKRLWDEHGPEKFEGLDLFGVVG